MIKRRTAVYELLKNRKDTIVINGLGGTCWDVASLGDNDLNFYVWGGMGNACMIGLGLALAQPHQKIIVITGDGEMLMGLGSLATIGVHSPKNLSIVVFDNELYGETGAQKTHTSKGVSLKDIAIGSGIKKSYLIYKLSELKVFSDNINKITNLKFLQIKISKDNGEMTLPIRDGSYLKNRFRKALLGEQSLYE